MRPSVSTAMIVLGVVCAVGILPGAQEMAAQQSSERESEMNPEPEKWSAAQQTLWTLEERYWTYLSEGNTDSVRTLWHDRFVGWPSHSAEPVARDAAVRSLEELLKNRKIISYELQPRAIEIHGNTAIVHYRALPTIAKPEGGQTTAPFRITHTWLNENGTWKIIGGMSAG